MSSQRFVLFAVAIFIVGALPFLIAQPSAAASAGLSLGFSAPLEHIVVLVILMAAGLAAALLPRDGLLLVPLSFTIMIMVGGMLALDTAQYPFIRHFVLGAVICMALLVGITTHKFTVFTLLVVGSLGFHLGGFYLAHVPAIASPMYYLLGILLSLTLVLAISVAFGMTLFGDHEQTWNRFKDSPRFAYLRKIFL